MRATGRRPRPDWLADAAGYEALDLVADPARRLRSALEGVSHVFHLAGASSSTATQDEMDRANVVGTRRLLEATSPGTLARFVHMSSTSVYGEEVQLPSPVREDVGPMPSRAYGKAKWAAEQAVWEHGRGGAPMVILRPVTVYGPGNVKLLASAILDVAIEARLGVETVAVPVEPIEQRLVHIDDLIEASLHVTATDEAVGQAFNVAGSFPSSHEVARSISQGFAMAVEPVDDPDLGPSFDDRSRAHAEMLAEGMKPSIIFTEERLRFLAKANRNNLVSVEALLATGFRFRENDLDADLDDTLAWYRRHSWVL